jgi:hypothetical protein
VVSFSLLLICRVLTDDCRVLESVKAGKRLSEASFALDIAPAGQQSVLGMFGR